MVRQQNQTDKAERAAAAAAVAQSSVAEPRAVPKAELQVVQLAPLRTGRYSVPTAAQAAAPASAPSEAAGSDSKAPAPGPAPVARGAEPSLGRRERRLPAQLRKRRWSSAEAPGATGAANAESMEGAPPPKRPALEDAKPAAAVPAPQTSSHAPSRHPTEAAERKAQPLQPTRSSPLEPSAAAGYRPREPSSRPPSWQGPPGQQTSGPQPGTARAEDGGGDAWQRTAEEAEKRAGQRAASKEARAKQAKQGSVLGSLMTMRGNSSVGRFGK